MKTKNFTYPRNSREISGFGGGYEKACKDMVIEGMKWLEKHPKADISYKEYENIYGLTTGESEDCKRMQNIMVEVNPGCSGAQMQACLSHIMFAHQHGWEKYIMDMERKENKQKVK